MSRASRRIAWIVAGVAVAVALFEAVALMLLMPFKTVVPYTLMVDRNTGYVQLLKPLEADNITPDSALTQSFLVQYVIAREGFDIDALQANYRKVILWSGDPARSDYVTGVQITNPGSPLARFPRTTVVEVRVKSVSPLGGKTALVRFDTQRRDLGGQVLPVRSWVAVIRYRFSKEPLQQSDRFTNPLGFQVLVYRRSQEQVVPVTEPAPIVAPAAGSVIGRAPPLSALPTNAPAGGSTSVPPPAPAQRLPQPSRNQSQSEVRL